MLNDGNLHMKLVLLLLVTMLNHLLVQYTLFLSQCLSYVFQQAAWAVSFLLRFVDSAETVFISISHLRKNSFRVSFECFGVLLRIQFDNSLLLLEIEIIFEPTGEKNWWEKKKKIIIERARSLWEKFHDTSHRPN